MKQLAIETPFDHLYRATLRLCDVSLYKWSKGVFSALRFSLCVHIVFLVQEFHLWSVELTIFILQPFIMLVLFCVIIPLLLSVLSHLLLVMNLLPIRSILHLDRMTWHLAFTSLYHWCLHRFIAFLDLLYPIMILIVKSNKRKRIIESETLVLTCFESIKHLIFTLIFSFQNINLLIWRILLVFGFPLLFNPARSALGIKGVGYQLRGCWVSAVSVGGY